MTTSPLVLVIFYSIISCSRLVYFYAPFCSSIQNIYKNKDVKIYYLLTFIHIAAPTPNLPTIIIYGGVGVIWDDLFGVGVGIII